MALITSSLYPLIMSYNDDNYYDYDGSAEIILNTFNQQDFRYGTNNGFNVYLRTTGTNLNGLSPVYDYISIGDDAGYLIAISDISLDYNGMVDVFNSPFANPNILMGADTIGGTDFNDELIGFRGADYFNAYGGDDIIRAGNGPDLITGGFGSDIQYGGFGKNAFFDNKDGYVDTIYVKSDQFAYNYLYDSAGNSPNGEKLDFIYDVDSFDDIVVQGVSTDRLTIGNYFGDIGIFADGYVEAVIVDSSLTINNVAFMVSGVI